MEKNVGYLIRFVNIAFCFFYYTDVSIKDNKMSI